MTERIDHVAEAMKCVEYANSPQPGSPEVAANFMAQAAVHATLALVEKQRVANLIAFMAMARQGVGAGEYSKDEYVRLHQKINSQVAEGLGL